MRMGAKNLNLVITCHACGEVTHVRPPDEPWVASIGVGHAGDCPFLAACEREEGYAWAEAHGYPISYEQAS
jgi:hypothetical protein